MIYASYSKMSKELLKKGYSKLSGPSHCLVIDQTNILTILIHNLKKAWFNKISMPFWVPWSICCKIFFKKVLMIWESSQNRLILSQGCSTSTSRPTWFVISQGAVVHSYFLSNRIAKCVDPYIKMYWHYTLICFISGTGILISKI